MKIHRAHKIRLQPNNQQANHLQQACGVARFAYNWGLGEWRRQHEAGEKTSPYALKKQFNSIKREQFGFVTDVTKCAAEQAFTDLGVAFKNFFRNIKAGKPPGYPRFKRRGIRDSFYIDNIQLQLKGRQVRIPRLGWVRMAEPLRLQGKIRSAVISCIAGHWFCSIQVEIETPDVKAVGPTVGVDVGIKCLAVTSDGRVFQNPKALRTAERRTRLLQKAVSRKPKGSHNRTKAIRRLQLHHYRVACIRADHLHKAAAAITKGAGRIVLEDLNVKGMMQNRRLAKALSDASLGELHRQIVYKAERLGIEIITADRFYPSSKTCSGCGAVKDVLTLGERIYGCEVCGLEIDRDLNAAINLKQLAEGSSVTACCLGSSGVALQQHETTDWAGISHGPT
ncbi:hypothetical protein LCGC14_0468950 [marine sediment metagenome]|uniref:Transposase IS891/IS1136/IS1341 domain-containing protein n=1 Tax=marine sediment metagenome TaxID=412755 RepID=A0A0F9SI30_9ZZZZ